MEPIAREVPAKQLRAFGLIVGGGFALIGLWPMLWRSASPRLWALLVAGALLLLGLALPKSLQPVYRLWMTIGQVLGWINTQIILGVLFYAVFTPMGLVMRLRGKDAMRRSFDPQADTYRVVRQPRPHSHMRHQF